MANYWIRALKEYNKNNTEEWCIPKKGSKGYDKLQEMVDIYKRTEENKQAKSNSAKKIQALVRGTQFRTNVLPTILFDDLAIKRFSN